MKVLITGFPGTGKTSIAAELKKRGHSAYDPEKMYAYMHLENRSSGKHLVMPENAERGWYDTTGAFNWDIQKVSHLLEVNADIFICSLANNMNLLADQFDLTFVLCPDDFTLEQRLHKRNTGLSTSYNQLQDILTLHKQFEDSLVGKGAIKVDVKADIPVIVDRILNAVQEKSS